MHNTELGRETLLTLLALSGVIIITLLTIAKCFFTLDKLVALSVWVGMGVCGWVGVRACVRACVSVCVCC